MSYTLVEMNAEYKRLTGEDAYLYAYNPGDSKGMRYVFATAPHSLNHAAALIHMAEALEQARNGVSHDEILYGKQRSQ